MTLSRAKTCFGICDGGVFGAGSLVRFWLIPSAAVAAGLGGLQLMLRATSPAHSAFDLVFPVLFLCGALAVFGQPFRLAPHKGRAQVMHGQQQLLCDLFKLDVIGL